MSIRRRLLGFAFASSDLLLELDAEGSVVFALGSGPSGDVSADSFCGVALWSRLAPAGADALRAVLASLRPGSRSAPTEILFNAGSGRMRRATARFFLYLNVRTRAEGWDIQTRFAALAARAGDEKKEKTG